MPFILSVVAMILLLSSGPLAAQDEAAAWPRQIEAPAAKILIYQPQLETFKGDRLTGRAAVSVTPNGKTEPTFGAMWIDARVSTDRDTRMVEILDAKVENVRFPEATTEQEDKFKRLVETEVPKWKLSISLDRLLASLELADKEKIVADRLNMTPPAITFVTYPAVLISIDGAPELRAVGDSTMMRVVNTAFTILQDPGSKTYYLYDGVDWRNATNIKGPWQKDPNPPKKVSELTPKPDPQDVPQDPKDQPEETDKPDEVDEADAESPILIVATEPAELIVSKGEPEYSPIDGTGLLYMSNTDSDVFKEIASQQDYVLLSGRWFRSESLKAPWTNVPSDKLPADFAKIPPESTKGDVLTFVAGTQQAKDAIMDAHIPQTTAVKRGGDNTVAVSYDGSPRFQKIEGTEVSYAINTDQAVFSIDRQYYCAYEGVWYVSNMVYGPFEVATSVPRELIDAIPPENPHYNAKYIYIYDSTPDVVYVGYTPGYTTTYVVRRHRRIRNGILLPRLVRTDDVLRLSQHVGIPCSLSPLWRVVVRAQLQHRPLHVRNRLHESLAPVRLPRELVGPHRTLRVPGWLWSWLRARRPERQYLQSSPQRGPQHGETYTGENVAAHGSACRCG